MNISIQEEPLETPRVPNCPICKSPAGGWLARGWVCIGHRACNIGAANATVTGAVNGWINMVKAVDTMRRRDDE